MCKGIIGKKLGMTGVYGYDGAYVPVTVLQVGPCVVTQIKTVEIDGYNALQLSFGEKKAKNTTKPLQGHFKKSGGTNYRFLQEFAVDNPQDYSLGQEISLDMFQVGESVDISGMIKGRGFAGVIKRHKFHGGRDTHGCRSHRVPGSIGCSAWPSKVIKGKKLPGHYGNSKKTIRNLKIVEIRPEDNAILVKGAVPGPKSGILAIRKLKFTK